MHNKGLVAIPPQVVYTDGVNEMSALTEASKLRKYNKMTHVQDLFNAVANEYLAKDFALAAIKGNKVYAVIIKDFAEVAWFYMENDGSHVRKSIRLDGLNVTQVIDLGYTWDFDKKAFKKYKDSEFFRAWYFEDMVAKAMGMRVNPNRHAPHQTDYDIYTAGKKYGMECKYKHARVLG